MFVIYAGALNFDLMHDCLLQKNQVHFLWVYGVTCDLVHVDQTWSTETELETGSLNGDSKGSK